MAINQTFIGHWNAEWLKMKWSGLIKQKRIVFEVNLKAIDLNLHGFLNSS